MAVHPGREASVPVFVILALALLAMAAGMAVVAALQLFRAARRARDALAVTQERLRPLAKELQSELAVTSTEAEALGRRIAAFGDARADRRSRGGVGRDRLP